MSESLAQGSTWHRWEPHIHAPGTVLNDQYSGVDPWEDFLKACELADPPLEVLGITDYLSIDCYEEVLRRKASGRLKPTRFVFPNVEMRFGVGTVRGSAINVHLLFSPDDPNHVSEIRRFLSKLEFRAPSETYRCTKEDLIRLGKAHDPSIQVERKALEEGTLQFKVSFDQLREEWEKSEWVRQNCIVAVAGGADGTSGLQDSNNAFASLRKTIESFSSIIFSSNPKQTQFWLGKGVATLEQLEAEWNGPKPCLHGSDAHGAEEVGTPSNNRRTWIKGEPSFDTLVQACIEPGERVHIGSEPPRGALAGQTIAKVRVTNADWMRPSEVPLNQGLIAIIGARGSGKTALADLIALGASPDGAHFGQRSFITRAAEHLTNCRSELDWEHGETTGCDLTNTSATGSSRPPVQYLSQQFVDDLCSSEGLAESLVREIERVVFNAHPEVDRDGASDFQELCALRSAMAIQRRARHEETLNEISQLLAAERLFKQNLPGLQKQLEDLVKQTAIDVKDRQSLVVKGQEDRVKRHEGVSAGLEARKAVLLKAQTQLRTLQALKDDVHDFRTRRGPAWLSKLKQERPDSGLSDSEWNDFNLTFTGPVDTHLEKRIPEAEVQIRSILGNPVTSGEDPNTPLILDDADLAQQSVSLLQAEVARLEKLIGVDAARTKRYAQLTEKITRSSSVQQQLTKQIEHAAGWELRSIDLRAQRKEAYAGVFSSITDLEAELRSLYAPVGSRLVGAGGSLEKLSFSVKRSVDLAKWASDGEALLDLRKNGPYKGRGTLLDIATRVLKGPWENGSDKEVSEAMSTFIAEIDEGVREHRPESSDPRIWAMAITSWLYSTAHISVGYGLSYDGIDVQRLSPGTRGIVLLLLYLAIDDQDDRPLIIDQPEENLDPQSVFDELVGRFRSARKRRQIIIVTHNANLVVNTDVDQVIIANAGTHEAGSLPVIQYEFGGLENAHIRKRVCEILEGGERAFKARAKRLRVPMA